MKLQASPDGSMKATFQDGAFFNASCERRFIKRCRAQGVNPTRMLAIVREVAKGVGKYTAHSFDGKITLSHTLKRNHIVSVKVPIWFNDYLEACTA